METTKVKKQKQKKYKSPISQYDWQLWALCIIPLAAVFIFSYIPMFGIIIAFKDYRYADGIFGSKWNGFKNFEFLFKSDTFVRITTNTLFMNFLFILCGTVAAISLAIILYKLNSRTGVKVYQTILITPNFISWVLASYMVYAILHPQNGTLNQLLGIFGLESIDWYSRPGAWPVILTISSVWKNIGMDCVVYYASLMGMDNSILEAAYIDGANSRQRNKYILIPHIMSLMIMLTILKIGGIFRADFGLFYQIPRNVGALYKTTDVIDTYIFRTMRVNGDMSTSSAAGLLQSVVGFILVMLTNWCVKKVDEDSALI